jgi:nucleotide-binding universal stress UspA family protein
VVVGVDVRRPRPATLDVAFRGAAQRGVPLVAVYAWSPDVPADHHGVICPVAVSAVRAEELLRRAFDPWVGRFADGPVAIRSSIGGPASVMLRESEGAALVVVGSGARRHGRRRALGSVSRDVVQRARCPVVVVPAAAVPVDERAGSGRRGAAADGEPLPPRRRRSPE